ncbi:glycosyltransferase [Nonomuraea angiospora]|uniref:glycosyltransferase n=1 Tax=Nonomuraea angiospora TaxID=46172 RepID=UPI0029BE49C1|nr:glycosyltransferase [Nonomuraea angiospora]MDX3103366.1 glycosyltransferase [Nonomuraea angiospora]
MITRIGARTVRDALAATSVIIPVRDDPRVTACVESVDEDVELVICLNKAGPDMRRRVSKLAGRVVVTEIPDANLGAAYNAAISVAGGRYLLFMDSDCVFVPGTIRTLATRVLRDPVVKGRVQFTSTGGRLSRWIEQSRSFQIADHVNAYSPPLIYDREIVHRIGGYHYSDLIHWEEDREFDFRLQLAGIRVAHLPDAIVRHAPQRGISDLRSGFRYGLGEGIGQELGLFITPALGWRLANDAGSVLEIARTRGVGPAVYRVAWLTAYHLGTLHHILADPYRVRNRYPAAATRIRARRGVPGHTTKLEVAHCEALRAAHLRQGRRIGLHRDEHTSEHELQEGQ